MRRRWDNRLVILLTVACWFAAIGLGFRSILNYEATAGQSGIPPAQWPVASSVIPDPNRANLVLIVHPRCSCSRATIDELENLMAHCQGLVAVHVLFIRPRGVSEGFERTDNWLRATLIPGVEVTCDVDGIEAERFGAETSGHVILYDAGGSLRFKGGLTNARGHAGESIGANAIVALLKNAIPNQAETPVFGCPLRSPCCRATDEELADAKDR